MSQNAVANATPTIDLFQLAQQVEDELMRLQEKIAILHCAHVGRQTMELPGGESSNENPEPYVVTQFFDYGIVHFVDEIQQSTRDIVDLVMKGGKMEGE